MVDKLTRVGGMRIDPGVAEWQRGAATNVAALSHKQRCDRERVRVKTDLPIEVKEKLAKRAVEHDTSESQLAAFLLAWALHELDEDDALQQALEQSKRSARALRFRWNLEIPEEFLRIVE